jgi:hypothetical protein
MNIAGIIGAVIGLVAALGGVFVGIWASGVMEYTGGKKKPEAASIGRAALLKNIQALNSPDLPYQIKPSQTSDLEIEWKIVDAKWLGIFAKEKIKQTYRACLVLDEAKHTVRYWEALGSVAWVAGAPKVHFRSEFFRGKIISQKSYGVQYGVKEDKTIGKVYEYKFDINAVRDPIRQAALEGGWEFVTALLKTHAMKG